MVSNVFSLLIVCGRSVNRMMLTLTTNIVNQYVLRDKKECSNKTHFSHQTETATSKHLHSVQHISRIRCLFLGCMYVDMLFFGEYLSGFSNTLNSFSLPPFVIRFGHTYIRNTNRTRDRLSSLLSRAHSADFNIYIY